MSIVDTFHAKATTSQAHFVADREQPFWVRARRNKLLADWACDLTDEDNQNYLKLLLDADFAKVESHAAEGFLLQKIRNDLMGFGIFLSPEQLREVFERFERQALLDRLG